MSIIPSVTIETIKNYNEKWDSIERNVFQEKSLELLFRKDYPENIIIENILIKVCCLNQFYSTNILSPIIVAKHILSLFVDKYFANDKIEIVNKIAMIEMPNGKNRNFYSYASKYCSFHYPESFPIYDYYVEKALLHYQKQDDFFGFKKEDLLNYPKFVNILSHFKEYYKTMEFSFKEIDKYLWQVGKEFFPKNYK